MLKQFHGLAPQPPYPWFAEIWTKFATQVNQNQLPHALLLHGPGGVGELDFAFAMAQYLLCNSPQNLTSCGTCKSCKLLQSESHPDLVSVSPEEKSSIIKVEAIRAVSEYAANTAQQGGRKLIVVYPAEAMNANSANALLKNLEEPNGDTVFLLVSQNPALLMATIRSRCSQWLLPTPSTKLALEWLERNKITDAGVKLAKAGGQPLKVVQWEADDTYARADTLAKLTHSFFSGEGELTKISKALVGFDALWVLDQWIQWLQIQAGQGSDTYAATAFANKNIQLFPAYDQLIVRKRQLLGGSNPNAQLLFEELLLDLKSMK